MSKSEKEVSSIKFEPFGRLFYNRLFVVIGNSTAFRSAKYWSTKVGRSALSTSEFQNFKMPIIGNCAYAVEFPYGIARCAKIAIISGKKLKVLLASCTGDLWNNSRDQRLIQWGIWWKWLVLRHNWSWFGAHACHLKTFTLSISVRWLLAKIKFRHNISNC